MRSWHKAIPGQKGEKWGESGVYTVVNEHFEPFFNAVSCRLRVFQQPVKVMLVTLCLGLLTTQAAQAESKNEQLERLFKTIDLDTQLHQIEAFALNEVSSRKELLTTEAYKKLRDQTTRAFDAQALRKDVINTFRENFQAQHLESWLAAVERPLIKRIRDLEKIPDNRDSYNQLLAYRQQLKKNPASPSRLELVKRLDTATAATDLAIDSQLTVSGAFIRLINPSLPDTKQLSEKNLQSLLIAMRPQLEPQLRQIARVTYLYTYRSISDPQLDQYVALYESETGQWLTATLNRGIRAALDNAVSRISKGLES
jgi:hypothetical protein